jgi:CheY-like chemotaxis protein
MARFVHFCTLRIEILNGAALGAAPFFLRLHPMEESQSLGRGASVTSFTRRWRVALVVEDEVLIRMFAAHDLRSAGLAVVEAANADEALELLDAGIRVDLLLTDVHMRGRMNGLELAKHVRMFFPDIKIVVASGDQTVAETNDFEFMRKPFGEARLAALATKVLSL